MSERATRWKAVALVLAGVLVGTLLIEPVGAHFAENTKHLGIHAWKEFIKNRVYTRNQVNARTYTRGQADARFERAGCTADMVPVGPTCIDRYEVSVWTAPTGGTQLGVTGDNYPCDDNGQDCKDKIFARSVPGVTPSRFITWFQAQAALTNVGKRLPTSAEWQAAAQGTPDPGTDDDATDCNITFDSGAEPTPTGSRSKCVSDYGAFDMVGNLWEQVADWDELAADCENWTGAGFGDDLTCMGRGEGDFDNHKPGVLLRGGAWSFENGDADAGVFAVLGYLTPATTAGNEIGFRGAR